MPSHRVPATASPSASAAPAGMRTFGPASSADSPPYSLPSKYIATTIRRYRNAPITADTMAITARAYCPSSTTELIT